jgi:hypothetical protein
VVPFIKNSTVFAPIAMNKPYSKNDITTDKIVLPKIVIGICLKINQSLNIIINENKYKI